MTDTNPTSNLQVESVGRGIDESLTVYFNRRPTQEEMLAFRESLRHVETSADAKLRAIISAYDDYRGRGVNPAPREYQAVVDAINAARPAVEPSSDSGAALFAVQGENARLREALRGVMECSGTSCRHYHIAHDALQPEKASGELCEGCPPVGYPTDETRCTPCPRRSEKVPRPRVPQNEHEATLTAIRTRDTESVPTWFKEPPLGACGRAFIDRRWLLKELDTLRNDMAQDQQRLFHLESALAKPTP